MRPRIPWIPLLLSSLALLTIVGGISVGHFYWTSLRSSMGQMADSMSQARERQLALLGQLDRTRALMAEQQERMREELEALKRREDAFAEARRKMLLEREELGMECSRLMREEQNRAREALRLLEAARLVENAGERLHRTDGVVLASANLRAARALVMEIETSDGVALIERLDLMLTRLEQLEPAGRDALVARLDALRAQAFKSRPGLRSPRQGRRGSRLAGADGAARHLALQLDTAAFALERGDEALFDQATQTAVLWLETFFDTRRADTQRLLAGLRQLGSHQAGIDLAEAGEELERLADQLSARESAIESASPDLSSGAPATGVPSEAAPGVEGSSVPKP